MKQLMMMFWTGYLPGSVSANDEKGVKVIQKLLTERLTEAGIEAGKKEINNSVEYLNAIWEANRYLNLTAARSIEELLNKHFIDSLYLNKYYSFKDNKELLDLGTGAGFPGLPLKLFNADIPLYMLDSARRKLSFIKYTADSIGLEQMYYLHGRAEYYGRQEQYREKFYYVCSRAVAAMPLLLEIGMPLVKVSGTMIIYKGPKGEEELKQSARIIDKLGGKLENNISYKLPGGEARIIYFIKKCHTTSMQYPRKKTGKKKPY